MEIRVCVDLGPVQTVRNRPGLTVQDLVAEVGQKVGLSAKGIKYCALLVTVGKRTYWPPMSHVLSAAETSSGPSNQIELQVRACAESYGELITTDAVLPQYLMHQLMRQVKSNSLPQPLPAIVALELAVIDIARLPAADGASKGKRGDVATATRFLRRLIDEQTLEPFLPSSLIHGMDKATLLGHIEGMFPRYFGLTEGQLVEKFLTIMLGQPSYGAEGFDSDINHGGAGISAAITRSGKVIVQPGKGIVFRFADALTDVIACDFQHVNSVFVSKCKVEVTTRGRLQGSPTDTLIFLTPEVALNFASLVDLYCILRTKASHSIVKVDLSNSSASPSESMFTIASACSKAVERAESETRLLKFASRDGVYMLCDRDVLPTDAKKEPYRLSVVQYGRVNHYKVGLHPSGKYGIADGVRFPTMLELMQHYHEDVDGLCCRLTANVLMLERASSLPASARGTTLLKGVALDPKGYVEGPPAPPRPSKSGTLKSSDTSFGFGFDEALPAEPPRRPSAAPSPAQSPRPTDLRDLEIPPRELTLGDKLGSGEFGEVVSGVWNKPGSRPVKCAIKLLKADGDPTAVSAFMQEATTWMAMRHPHIVTLLGVSTIAPMKLVCELVACGALNNYLRDDSKGARQLTVTHLLQFVSQIAHGMEFLEEQGFVHRDLAARNVLVAAIDLVKISDFGLSRSVGDHDYYQAAQAGKWPLKWYALECIYHRKFTSKSDVWSYGVTAWEVFSRGKKPYKGLKGAQVVQTLESGGRLERPDECPMPMFEVMRTCWEESPDRRPTFKALHVSCERICDDMRRGQSIKISREDMYASFLASQVVFEQERHADEVAIDEAEELGARRLQPAAGIRETADHIQKAHLRIESTLSEGDFGPLCMGTLTGPRAPGGRPVAVLIKPIKMADTTPDSLQAEAAIMSSLQNPYLVTLYGLAVFDGHLRLVSELSHIGSINKYLQVNAARVSQGAIAKFLTQVRG